MNDRIQIGTLSFPLGLFACPLAGITKRANRVLARRYGCEMVYTEMIKAAGLIHGNKKSWNLLKRDRVLEDVLGVQLAEGDPDTMASAVKKCADLNFDVIDINMGCPARRIASDCAGAGALKNAVNAREVMRAAKANAGNIPVTVKIRVGWDHGKYVHVKYAQIAQEEGLAAITVHGRTADDKYSTPVNYGLIKEVVDAVDIPVIGNGDVKDGPTALKMFEETGCAGVMIGRASQGNPWVFREVQHYLTNGSVPGKPNFEEVLSVLSEHFTMLIEDEGEYGASLQVRKLGSWYLQGYVKRSYLHTHIYKISSAKEFYSFLEDIKNPTHEDCLV